jgi:uncharacterized protein (DUF1697 family)
MAFVVFLRAANVGGHNKFKPSLVAKELARELDVANVGAAGTFVVRDERVSAREVHAAIVARLPFEAGVMVCPGREILDLARRHPFGRRALAEGHKRFVSVLERAPRATPAPAKHPAGSAWQVHFVGVEGRYALSLWRRTGERGLYPNEVVEKTLGLGATTRVWETLGKVAALLPED